MSVTWSESRTITTKNGNIYRKPSKTRVAGGVIAGGISYYGIKNKISKFGGRIYGNTIFEQCANNHHYRDAVIKAFEKSKLRGIVELVDAKDIEKINKVFNIKRHSSKKLKNSILETVNGFNAFYSHSAKDLSNQKIFVNLDKMSEAVFHEMGHAINRNFSKIGFKLQQICEPAKALCMVGLASALLIRKKENGEKPKNIFDRIGIFLKNNCGLIAGIGYLPTLAEETLATINGNKIAKQFLTKDNFKKLKIHNAKALFTYVAAGTGITTGVIVASKIRDLITKPKKVKS